MQAYGLLMEDWYGMRTSMTMPYDGDATRHLDV